MGLGATRRAAPSATRGQEALTFLLRNDRGAEVGWGHRWGRRWPGGCPKHVIIIGGIGKRVISSQVSKTMRPTVLLRSGRLSVSSARHNKLPAFSARLSSPSFPRTSQPARAMSATTARRDPYKPAARVASQRQDVWYAPHRLTVILRSYSCHPQVNCQRGRRSNARHARGEHGPGLLRLQSPAVRPRRRQTCSRPR